MSRDPYYDRQGNSVGMEEFAKIFEADRIVAQDKQLDVMVSTVFLGLDHNYGDGPPLIFETMIFGGPLDQWQDRYSTEEEAKLGHERACILAFRKSWFRRVWELITTDD